MPRFRAFLCLSLLIAHPVAAQEPATDWDLVRDDRQKLVMAYTVFDVGLGITFRCLDGGFDAVIGGLPDAGGRDQRPLSLTFDDDRAPHANLWNVAVDETMAVSPLPAPLARKMREGGRLQLRVPDGAGEGRALRYDLELPASAAAIDATLTACGKPLVDPRDAELEELDEQGLPGGIQWVRRPQPEWPSARRQYAKGFANVTCLTSPDGALRDCVIETEHPRDGGFGDEVLSSVRRARVGPVDGEGPLPVRRMYFQVSFVMDGYSNAEDRERRRRSREAERREREAARQGD